jgi:site-specific DNA-methyltransferase (adenine-specific)
MEIQISKIQITTDNPRKEFNAEKVREIGKSILKHGQIHPIIVRSLPNDFYELVTGEMRVRGCMAVGLDEIDADIRDLTDTECKVLRLVENVQRSDLTDAEKGDAVIELAEATDKSYKDIAETELNVPEKTVYQWIWKASRISPKLGELLTCKKLADKHAQFLIKYPHSTQDQLATFIVDWNQSNPNNKITSTNIGNFCKEYDKDQNVKLEDIAKKITGFVSVTTWQPKSTVPTTPPVSKPKTPKSSLPDSECCIATTTHGIKCKAKRLPNSEYCSRHNRVKRDFKGMTEHSRRIIFSSEHDDWTTPPDKYKELDDEFHFNFDPCPLNPDFDGLIIDWKERNFINPPYSNIVEFLKKGHQELDNGHATLLVYLIPVRTDTNWFHTYIYPYFKKKQCEIRFIKGRVKFSNGTGSKHSAPFPSMLVVFDRREN